VIHVLNKGQPGFDERIGLFASAKDHHQTVQGTLADFPFPICGR
jgi:hypothetical protein